MAARDVCPNAEYLADLIEGRLPGEEQRQMTAHLDRCPRCQQVVEEMASSQRSWDNVARCLAQRIEDAQPSPALKLALERAEQSPANGETQAEPATDDGEWRAYLGTSDHPESLGRLGAYEVMGCVGRGGMGVVLQGFDPSLHRVVAIKLMSPQLASSGNARKRFEREGRAAAAVVHEHVVTIHGVDEVRGLPYLVMQHVAGMSLQDRLDRSGSLALKEILRIGMQTAQGLAAAHAQGIIHRDVKPANILLENGVERVKITDFGLARAADDASLTRSNVIAGTPLYMSPEQARGESVDHRADLFSLGSVLYALCTGRPPFRAPSPMAVLKRVCDDTPRSIREINPEVPEWLCAIVEKLHAKDPKDRFQSAAEVAELLGQHLAHLQRPDLVPRPAPVETPPGAEPAPKPSWFTAVAAVLLGVGLLGFVVMHRDAQKPYELLAVAAVLGLAGAWNFFGQRPSWAKKCVIALVLLGFAGWWLGPNLWLLGEGMAHLRVEALSDGLDAVIVRRGGEIVKVLGPGDMDSEFEPGMYELEALCRPGMGVSEVYRNERELFSFEGATERVESNRYPLGLKKGAVVDLELAVGEVRRDGAQEWEPLFNGRDLTGWAGMRDPTWGWTVRNGSLVSPQGNTPLLSERADFRDFHVRALACLEENAAVSLFLSCPQKPDPGGRVLLTEGYEVRLTAPRPQKAGTGLARTTDKPERVVPMHVTPGEWFLLEVRPNGDHLVVSINGRVQGHIQGKGVGDFGVGRIGLQPFARRAQAHFRRLEVFAKP